MAIYVQIWAHFCGMLTTPFPTYTFAEEGFGYSICRNLINRVFFRAKVTTQLYKKQVVEAAYVGLTAVWLVMVIGVGLK